MSHRGIFEERLAHRNYHLAKRHARKNNCSRGGDRRWCFGTYGSATPSYPCRLRCEERRRNLANCFGKGRQSWRDTEETESDNVKVHLLFMKFWNLVAKWSLSRGLRALPHVTIIFSQSEALITFLRFFIGMYENLKTDLPKEVMVFPNLLSLRIKISYISHMFDTRHLSIMIFSSCLRGAVSWTWT